MIKEKYPAFAAGYLSIKLKLKPDSLA